MGSLKNLRYESLQYGIVLHELFAHEWEEYELVVNQWQSGNWQPWFSEGLCHS